MRKALTILSLIGLLLSVGLWGSSAHDRDLHVGFLSAGRCLMDDL